MQLISRQFLKTSFLYTVAGALPMASAVVLLPFYVTYLSTELFGALAIYLALSMLVQILVTFSFDSSIYVHYHDFKTDRNKLAEFVSSCFGFMLLLSAVVVLFGAFTGEFIFVNLFSRRGITFFPYGILSVISGSFQALFKVNTSLLQSRQQPARFLWSNLLNFSLTAVLTIAGLSYFPESLIGPVGARTVAAIVSGTGALIRIYNEFGMHYNYALLRSTFGFNAYSFIYQLQLWAVNYFDRIIMVFFLPLQQVGVYDFAFKCMLVIEIALSGLFNSFYPKVIGKVAEQKQKGTTIEINRYYHGLTAAAVLVVAGCIFLYPLAFGFFYIQPGYRDALIVMPLIGIIYLLRPLRMYVSMPFSVLKYSKPLPLYYLVVTSVKIGVMILSLPVLKLYGVILASACALVVEIILLCSGSRGRFAFNNFNVHKMVLAPMVFGFIILVTEILDPPVNQQLIHMGYLGFGVLLLLWIYRNELRMIDPLLWIR